MSNTNIPSIAKKDIVGYKVVGIRETENFGAELYPLLAVNSPLVYNIYGEETRALGACSIKERTNGVSSYYMIEEGFIHMSTSYLRIRQLERSMIMFPICPVIVKCTIPKGTLYFKDTYMPNYCARKVIIDY